MINENPIFKSESGESFSVDQLIECLKSHASLYNFKKNELFSVKELNAILAIEEVFLDYRELFETKQGPLLLECEKIQGDTLHLLEKVMDVFKEGAKPYGLANFLISENFIAKFTAPAGELYEHLRIYPLEREALSEISRKLKQTENFISYFDNIIKEGACSSAFPQMLFQIISVVEGLKVYLAHENKRASQEAKADQTASPPQKAFFDVKPMTEYRAIKIENLAMHPEKETTIKKFITYLNSQNVNYEDVPVLSIENNQLVVYTQHNRDFKIKLRDKIIAEDLQVSIENIPQQYKFIITDINELEKKLTEVTLAERDVEGVFKALR